MLPPNPKAATEKKIFLIDRPNSVQTSIMLGNIAIDRRDPDYITLQVFNQILGGSGAARLFLNLREEHGYTYGVYSSLTALKYPGPWRAYGDFRTEVTGGAMTEFFKSFNAYATNAFRQVSLTMRSDAIVASFALSLESNDDLLGYAIVRKVYGFPIDYLGHVSGEGHGRDCCRRAARGQEVSQSGKHAGRCCGGFEQDQIGHGKVRTG